MQKVDYKGFNDALLSLRGLAAVAVLIFHGILVFQVDGYSFGPYDHTFISFAPDAGFAVQLQKWIVMATNGHAAVTFFFVHSGFVLALSMSKMSWGKRPFDIVVALTSYAVKRIFRLWPMIALSCILAFFYQSLSNNIASPNHSIWYTGFFSVPTNLLNLLRNIALQQLNLEPFLWSLLVESYGSILMPLFYYLGRRVITTYLLFVGFYILTLAFSSGVQISVLGWVFGSATVVFLFSFAIGAQMAFVRGVLPAKPLWINQNGLVLTAFVILVAARWIIPSFSVAVVIESLASAIIVYIVYYYDDGPLQWFCKLPIVKFLGLISFSLYVNSLIFIHISGQILTRVFPNDFIAEHGFLMNISALAIAASLVIPFSYLTYRFVESPFMRTGKKAAALIAGLHPFVGPPAERKSSDLSGRKASESTAKDS